MYANKNYKTDGKVYYMPNKIFDENFSPHEFMIYCFLVSVGDSKGVSFWSVPKMAKKCNMCPTTCRNTLKSLEEKGYIDITQKSRNFILKRIKNQFKKLKRKTAVFSILGF